MLIRELTQIAVQRSTYITRGLTALILYVVALISLYAALRTLQTMNSVAGMRSVLGDGKAVLMGLSVAVSIGIYVILPAMVVGTVTTERENGTLDLMLVTRLGPWEIVFQKLFARVIPVLSLLLLTAPIMAIAYTLGGVSVGDIALALSGWVVSCFRLAALALMCSALCRTTVSAFLVTYGVLLGLTIGTPFVGFLFIAATFGSAMGGGVGRGFTLTIQALSLIPVVVCLMIARYALVRSRRRGGGGAKTAFQRADRLLERANRRVGSVRWGREESALPEMQPVAWRERAGAVVCMPRHLFRVLAIINIPVGFILLMIVLLSLVGGGSFLSGRGEVFGCSAVMGLLWIPVALVLTVYVANLMSKERVNQTLEVLLTTPLTEDEILRQKLAAVPRLCLVLASPLLLTLGAEFFSELDHTGRNAERAGDALLYALISLYFIGVYLYAVAWITFSASLKPRRRARVVAMALARICAFIFVPFLLTAMASGMNFDIDEESLMMMSPAFLLAMLEFDKSEFFDHGWAAVVNGLLFLGLALLARARALHWARLHLRKG